VLCVTVVHNDMHIHTHTHVQFLKMSLSLGLGLVFMCLFSYNVTLNPTHPLVTVSVD